MQQPMVRVDPRYIDRAKLATLLSGLFPPGTYAAEVRSLGLVQGIPQGLS